MTRFEQQFFHTQHRTDSWFAPANERRRYKVTPPLIGWVQT